MTTVISIFFFSPVTLAERCYFVLGLVGMEFVVSLLLVCPCSTQAIYQSVNLRSHSRFSRSFDSGCGTVSISKT